jgi:hypothetical protein
MAGLVIGYALIGLTILFFALFDIGGNAGPEQYILGPDGDIPVTPK